MSQVDLIRSLLTTGPKTRQQLVAGGVSEYELRARMTDLRRRLQRQGGDILHRDGPEPTWELCLPV
jgi:hypothetical protein